MLQHILVHNVCFAILSVSLHTILHLSHTPFAVLTVVTVFSVRYVKIQSKHVMVSSRTATAGCIDFLVSANAEEM